MKCEFCRKRAGFLSRVCSTCAKVVAIVERTAGQVGLAQLVDIFAAEGLSREQVDRVLDAENGGRPTIRDRLTSNMVNTLMRGLGMPGRQSPDDVRRVRSAAALQQDSDDTDGKSAAAGRTLTSGHSRLSEG